MSDSSVKSELLSIPWMKQKLELMYDTILFGDLYLMFNLLELDTNNINSSVVNDLLSIYNIKVDDSHPLYLYLPAEVNEVTKKLIYIFKDLYNNNVFIILVGYKEYYPTSNELDCIADLYMFYPNLAGTIHNSYLIDSSKAFEIFTALSDIQRIYVDPKYACTISAPIFNYSVKHNNSKNIVHISFIKLLEDSYYNNIVEYYLRGLRNTNNNFNFNY